jgi:hypothetical protein
VRLWRAVDGSVRERVGVALIAVDYRDSAHPDLPLLRKGVEELGQLWAQKPVKPPSDPRKLLDTVRQWCRELCHDDILLLYWGGHGAVDGGKQWLLTRDSPTTGLYGHVAVEPDDLGRVLAHSPAKAVLVVIDACYSGQALRDIADAVLSVRAEQHAVPPFGVLASCRPFQEASDGVLVERVVELLQTGPTVDPNRWTEMDNPIRIGAFVAELRDSLGEQRPEWIDHQGISELWAIPNPRWTPVVDEADVETKSRLRALVRSGAASHFLTSSGPGRTYGDDDVRAVLATAGWYVKESGEDGQTVYRLYHQTFADHFRAQTPGVEHKVQATITGALRALAERLPGGGRTRTRTCAATLPRTPLPPNLVTSQVPSTSSSPTAASLPLRTRAPSREHSTGQSVPRLK